MSAPTSDNAGGDWRLRGRQRREGLTASGKRARLIGWSVALSIVLAALIAVWLWSPAGEGKVWFAVQAISYGKDRGLDLPARELDERHLSTILSQSPLWAPLFPDGANWSERLRDDDSPLDSAEKTDTLFLYLAAQCFVRDGAVVYGKSDLIRETDSARYRDPGNLEVGELDTLLQTVSDTPARHKIVLIDAGNLVFDPVLGTFGNRCLEAWDRLLKKIDDPDLWVLVSHSDGQISLQDPIQQRSVFAMAVQTALQGRTSSNTSSAAGARLPFGQFCESVVREVQHHRHNGRPWQTPVLLRGSRGRVDLLEAVRCRAFLRVTNQPKKRKTASGSSAPKKNREEEQPRQNTTRPVRSPILALAARDQSGKSASDSSPPKTTKETPKSGEASPGKGRSEKQPAGPSSRPPSSSNETGNSTPGRTAEPAEQKDVRSKSPVESPKLPKTLEGALERIVAGTDLQRQLLAWDTTWTPVDVAPLRWRRLQRRWVEAERKLALQFLGGAKKPDPRLVEELDGLTREFQALRAIRENEKAEQEFWTERWNRYRERRPVRNIDTTQGPSAIPEDRRPREWRIVEVYGPAWRLRGDVLYEFPFWVKYLAQRLLLDPEDTEPIDTATKLVQALERLETAMNEGQLAPEKIARAYRTLARRRLALHAVWSSDVHDLSEIRDPLIAWQFAEVMLNVPSGQGSQRKAILESLKQLRQGSSGIPDASTPPRSSHENIDWSGFPRLAGLILRVQRLVTATAATDKISRRDDHQNDLNTQPPGNEKAGDAVRKQIFQWHADAFRKRDAAAILVADPRFVPNVDERLSLVPRDIIQHPRLVILADRKPIIVTAGDSPVRFTIRYVRMGLANADLEVRCRAPSSLDVRVGEQRLRSDEWYPVANLIDSSQSPVEKSTHLSCSVRASTGSEQASVKLRWEFRRRDARGQTLDELPLDCYVRQYPPPKLEVARSVWRNPSAGETIWRPLDSEPVLRPFSRRSTPFRFRITNRSAKEQAFRIRVYAVDEPFDQAQRNGLDLNRLDSGDSAMRCVATAETRLLVPGSYAVLRFKTPAKSAPKKASSKEQGKTKPTSSSGAGSPSTLKCLLFLIVDAKTGMYRGRQWVNLRVQPPRDYVRVVESAWTDDGIKIKLKVDEAPPRFDKVPVVVHWEGPLLERDPGPPPLELTARQPEGAIEYQYHATKTDRTPPSPTRVLLSVDGYPRALVWRMRPGGRGASESLKGVHIASYRLLKKDVDPKKTPFLPFPQQEEKRIVFDPNGQKVEKVELRVQADWGSFPDARLDFGAFNASGALSSLSSDRNIRFLLEGAEGDLSLNAVVDDWVLPISIKQGRNEIRWGVRLRVAEYRDEDALLLLLDSTRPQVQKVHIANSPVAAGDSLKVVVSAHDPTPGNSGIQEVRVGIDATGTGKLDPKSRYYKAVSPSGPRTSVSLPTAGLAPATYQLVAQVVDAAGHVSEPFSQQFSLNPKASESAGHGKMKASQGDIVVTVKEGPAFIVFDEGDVQLQTEDGKPTPYKREKIRRRPLTFLWKDVPFGKYRIVLSYKVSGRTKEKTPAVDHQRERTDVGEIVLK